MENEDTFLSDVNVEAAFRRGPVQKRTAKMAAKTAPEGADTDPATSHGERSPLLARQSDSDWNDEDGSGERAPQPAWVDDDYSQWDGLPWYKRPSVSSVDRS